MRVIRVVSLLFSAVLLLGGICRNSSTVLTGGDRLSPHDGPEGQILSRGGVTRGEPSVCREGHESLRTAPGLLPRGRAPRGSTRGRRPRGPPSPSPATPTPRVGRPGGATSATTSVVRRPRRVGISTSLGATPSLPGSGHSSPPSVDDPRPLRGGPFPRREESLSSGLLSRPDVEGDGGDRCRSRVRDVSRTRGTERHLP